MLSRQQALLAILLVLVGEMFGSSPSVVIVRGGLIPRRVRSRLGARNVRLIPMGNPSLRSLDGLHVSRDRVSLSLSRCTCQPFPVAQNPFHTSNSNYSICLFLYFSNVQICHTPFVPKGVTKWPSQGTDGQRTDDDEAGSVADWLSG